MGLKEWTGGAALVAAMFACGVGSAQTKPEGRLGHVDFSTSARSPAAQGHFTRGLLLLHSFEYPEAASEFREAQKLEPGFAMAYWGEAMTQNHPIWNERDPAAAKAILERLAPTPEQRLAKAPTDREKGYLSAVETLFAEGDKLDRDKAYAEAMRKLHEAFPGDDDAACFYALSLLGTCEGECNVAIYEQAGSIAEEVFSRRPDHPGAAHYVIHCYDDPEHAEKALPAARAYSKIAPAAPHALHMPSHIFLALGMWDEVIASNRASWKASGKTSYHALSWLQYAELQEGHFEDARNSFREMVEAVRKDTSVSARTHLVAMRAAQIVETDGRDAEALATAVDTADLPSAHRRDQFLRDGIRACTQRRGSIGAAFSKSAAADRRGFGEGLEVGDPGRRARCRGSGGPWREGTLTVQDVVACFGTGGSVTVRVRTARSRQACARIVGRASSSVWPDPGGSRPISACAQESSQTPACSQRASEDARKAERGGEIEL